MATDRSRLRFEEEALALADQVYRIARALVESRDDADELLKETYARAFRSWRGFTPGTDLRAWLVRILTSLDRDPTEGPEDRRREERDSDLYDRLEESSGAASLEGEAPNGWLSRDRVVGALAAVPHEARDALVLVDIGEFGHTDAARILGLSVEALVRRLHRGRRILEWRLAEPIGGLA